MFVFELFVCYDLVGVSVVLCVDACWLVCAWWCCVVSAACRVLPWLFACVSFCGLVWYVGCIILLLVVWWRACVAVYCVVVLCCLWCRVVWIAGGGSCYRLCVHGLIVVVLLWRCWYVCYLVVL